MRHRLVQFIILTIWLLSGCNSATSSRSIVRIGVDPDWYSTNFGSQVSYVNGFVEELLLELSEMTGIRFERIDTNWDSLYEGLKKKRYDAVLSAMPPYEFYKAEYDFSNPFLDLGPVLIVPISSDANQIEAMVGKRVGIVQGDTASSILQKYPGVMVRDTYSSIPDLLQAVVAGEIEGAILDRILAVNYLQDLFSGKLKVAGPPLNDLGLRLLTMQGQHSRLVSQFDDGLNALEKNKKLQTLQVKWLLGF